MDTELIRRADIMLQGNLSLSELSRIVGVTPQALCSNFKRLKVVDAGRYEKVRVILENNSHGDPAYAGKIGGTVRWCQKKFSYTDCENLGCIAFNTCLNKC